MKTLKQKFKKVFDTWNWRNYNFGYVSRWRNAEKVATTPLVDFMNEKGLPFREWDSLFNTYGLDFYEIMKKLTMEEMISPRFESLTANEKAMLGTTVFLEFMKQLRLEIEELDREKE